MNNPERHCKCGCGELVTNRTKREKLFAHPACRSRYFKARREAAKWLALKSAASAYVMTEEEIGPAFTFEKRLILVLESPGETTENPNIIQRFDVLHTGSPKMFELRAKA